MFYDLVTAKTNASTELLLLIDDKIVSQWPYDPEDQALKNIGDLRGWENQLENGRDLSRCQADYDNDVLQLERMLAVQCTAAEYLAEYDVTTVMTESSVLHFDAEVSVPIKDYDDCWGSIDLINTGWIWDKKSGKPKDNSGNGITDLKIFLSEEDEV